MVTFLEKRFEFTTTLSMDECVVRLKEQSTRKSGFFATRQEILVRISDDVNGKAFILDRDSGRNLYAEIHGQLRRNHDGSTHVSGFGRISLFTFLFTIFFAAAVGFVIYYLNAPEFLIFGILMIIVNLVLLLLTFNNRNNLIYVVEQVLDRSD
jgi:hypothetical protein